MTSLLSCPFCGCAAELDTQRAYHTMGRNARLDTKVAIYCTQCSADHCLCRADHAGVDTEALVAQVIEAWNRRAPIDEIKELRGALKPFAAFAEKAEAFVEARARDGGSPILPSTDFRLFLANSTKEQIRRLHEAEDEEIHKTVARIMTESTQ